MSSQPLSPSPKSPKEGLDPKFKCARVLFVDENVEQTNLQWLNGRGEALTEEFFQQYEIIEEMEE